MLIFKVRAKVWEEDLMDEVFLNPEINLPPTYYGWRKKALDAKEVYSIEQYLPEISILITYSGEVFLVKEPFSKLFSRVDKERIRVSNIEKIEFELDEEIFNSENEENDEEEED